MKLNPNAVPFAFTPVEENNNDAKRPHRYELEEMLALKSHNVRVLPQMQKHEHSKHFLKFSYDLHYMLSLKAQNHQPPASIPSWFPMIYQSHYSPGKPLPEIKPKSDDVRFVLFCFVFFVLLFLFVVFVCCCGDGTSNGCFFFCDFLIFFLF